MSAILKQLEGFLRYTFAEKLRVKDSDFGKT